MRLEGEVAKDSSLRCGKKILEFQLIFISNFYFVTALQWNNIFNSIHIFSICMQYSLLNIPEGSVRLDSLETGFEAESCIQRLIGSARGWYACQEERGQAVAKLALGPLAHCAAKPIYWHQVDLENIFPVSLFWAIMGSFLTNEYHLTFSPTCSLSSNSQELRVSPPHPFHRDLLTCMNLQLLSQSYSGDMGLPCGQSEDPRVGQIQVFRSRFTS